MNKEIVSKIFPEAIKRMNDGKCPACDEPVSEYEFVDFLSLKEYTISGFCQKCQDEVFGDQNDV